VDGARLFAIAMGLEIETQRVQLLFLQSDRHAPKITVLAPWQIAAEGVYPIAEQPMAL
jgi:hypothetical protein